MVSAKDAGLERADGIARLIFRIESLWIYGAWSNLFWFMSWRRRREVRERPGVFLLLVVKKGSPIGCNIGRGVPEGRSGTFGGTPGASFMSPIIVTDA